MPKLARRGRAPLAASVSLLWWVCACVVCAVLLAPADAQAYPWMIRHGYSNCGACHADPSGGELLTPYGHGVSYEVLSTKFGGSEQSARRLERRVARAVARAASAKSAPPKKPAAEEVKLEEEGAAEPAGDDEKPAEEKPADAEDGAEAPKAEEKAAAPEIEDEDADAEEEAAPEEAAASDASASAAGASEETSPYAGMNPITGPLFGLLPANDDLLIGGSIRLASTYDFDAEEDKFRFFPMQADLYGQIRFAKNLRVNASVGVSKVAVGSPHARPAQVTTAQGEDYNLISRTHWIGYDFGEGAHTVRAGRLNLPFGIRMSEHVMWVRERTQTDRESDQQHGVALYMGFDALRFEIMGIAGNYQVNPDDFRERGYSAYVEYFPDPKVGIGLSSLLTVAQDDRLQPEGEATTRQAHGPFVRLAPSETVSVMAEADVLMRSRRGMGYVGYLQADIEPFQGFHLIGTGEVFDAGFPDEPAPGTNRSAGFGKPQPGGWFSFQWFFLPHFDLRVDMILRDEETQLLSQLHVYL